MKDNPKEGNIKVYTCSFCGMKSNDPLCNIMMTSEHAAICTSCVFACYATMLRQLADPSKPGPK